MTATAWQQDPLAFLLGSEEAQRFFADYYEQQALVRAHQDSARFADLLSLKRIDELLASSELPPRSLDMARKQPPLKRSFFTFSDGSIDRGAVLHHYQRGATIILPQMHLSHGPLADFCRALETVFSTRVQTNIYLTPANNQGFSTHYDDHDVFVMQVSGEKRWRLYERPVENPYRGEKFRAAEHKPGHPKDEFILRAGDCVYIPRGLMHDAESHGSEPSLHITVGLLGQSWADLMLEALSEMALRHPAFRRLLPPGYTDADYDTTQAMQQFQELLDLFREEADFQEPFELMREKFLRGRRPNLAGSLLSSSTAADDIAAGVYALRTHFQGLLRHDDTRVVLVSAGGDIHFPAAALRGLQSLLAGDPVDRTHFSDLNNEQIKETLQKLVAFGVAELAGSQDQGAL